jgi:hypothetical protein
MSGLSHMQAKTQDEIMPAQPADLILHKLLLPPAASLS